MKVIALSSSLYLALLGAFVILSASPALHAQADPVLGTWKLNLAKSKYESGPPPKSEVRTYEPAGTNGVRATFRRIDSAGKAVTITYTALYDGKDYAYAKTASSSSKSASDSILSSAPRFSRSASFSNAKMPFLYNSRL